MTSSFTEPEWDDEQVILTVKNGDIDKFSILVDRYQTKAIHLAYGLLRNYADANEAVQDAFLSAYQALPQYKMKTKFSTWFYAIVYNKCRDRLRKQNRIPAMIRLDSQDLNGNTIQLPDTKMDDPEATAQDKELATVIADALSHLSAKQCDVFTHCHIHGRTLKETATIMNCRTGTVKSHLFRATRQLQKLLMKSLKEVSNEA